MGKKIQGAKLRAKQRAVAAAEEIQEQQAERAAMKSAVGQALFVIDTTGDTVPHHERVPNKEKLEKKRASKTALSEKDKAQVERLLEKHDAKKLNEIVAQGKKILETDQRMVRKSVRGQTKTNFDLWDDKNKSTEIVAVSKNDDAVVKKNDDLPKPAVGSALAGTRPAHSAIKAAGFKKKKDPVIAVDVAKSGQSYHPDPVAHQAILQKAAQAELLRESKTREMKAPLAQGMSEETRALLVGSDDDDSSDEEASESGELVPVGPLAKRSNKLTRAQRNKRRRHKIELAAIKKRQAEKKFLKQIGNIPTLKKEITKKEKEIQQRQQEKQQRESEIKVAGQNVELKAFEQDPLRAPTVPVALSNELKSSLRAIKPKGSLLSDRLASFQDRQLLHDSKKKRKAEISVAAATALDTSDPSAIHRASRRKNKKRRKALKGKHNQDWKGDGFQILGC